MSIRTTVTLDEDVIEKLRRESRTRGASVRDTLNDLLRFALMSQSRPNRRSFRIKPAALGLREGLNYDDVSTLIAYGEGERHK